MCRPLHDGQMPLPLQGRCLEGPPLLSFIIQVLEGGDAVDLAESVDLYRDVFQPLCRRDMNPAEKQMHVQATVGAHGSVTLDQLPYEPGQRVDVTISPISSQVADQTRRYSLSGLKVEYEQPFESVAADEWEATK